MLRQSFRWRPNANPKDQSIIIWKKETSARMIEVDYMRFRIREITSIDEHVAPSTIGAKRIPSCERCLSLMNHELSMPIRK